MGEAKGAVDFGLIPVEGLSLLELGLGSEPVVGEQSTTGRNLHLNGF